VAGGGAGRAAPAGTAGPGAGRGGRRVPDRHGRAWRRAGGALAVRPDAAGRRRLGRRGGGAGRVAAAWGWRVAVTERDSDLGPARPCRLCARVVSDLVATVGAPIVQICCPVPAWIWPRWGIPRPRRRYGIAVGRAAQASAPRPGVPADSATTVLRADPLTALTASRGGGPARRAERAVCWPADSAPSNRTDRRARRRCGPARPGPFAVR